MNVTLFRHFNIVIHQCHITEVLEQIKSGKYKQQIILLQQLLKSGETDEYNIQKKSLPAFTPSATFEDGRKMEFLEEYSGLIILDIDKLSPDLLPIIKQKAKDIANTYSVFNSPSANGLKI